MFESKMQFFAMRYQKLVSHDARNRLENAKIWHFLLRFWLLGTKKQPWTWKTDCIFIPTHRLKTLNFKYPFLSSDDCHILTMVLHGFADRHCSVLKLKKMSFLALIFQVYTIWSLSLSISALLLWIFRSEGLLNSNLYMCWILTDYPKQTTPNPQILTNLDNIKKLLAHLEELPRTNEDNN